MFAICSQNSTILPVLWRTPEQWQDELKEKFSLDFDILSRDQIEASITDNPSIERHRMIVRLDMAARSDVSGLDGLG